MVTVSELENQEFETSAKIAQIFSGVTFLFIVAYLLFSNSTKLSFIQQASQEKRLAVCCSISTMVAAISCFLSFFQITEVDNHVLPKNDGYTVDMARPLEWILTCPLMQLTLVLMGGSRIPEYRRFFMPIMSAVIIGFGTLSLFLDGWQTIACNGCGLIVFCIMAFFNRLQIIEHSGGEEGLFKGDSEFRKATLILLGTWLPFPTWYALSPEGFDVIDNILIIQMGWMLLNILTKGSSILYIQRAKDNYCGRLKLNRLIKESRPDAFSPRTTDEDDAEQENDYASASLRPCVIETMTFLGMAEKADRLLRLLKKANVQSLEQIQSLTPKQCNEKKLPAELISALQQRHKIWKLEVQDAAEEDIEKCEAHYAKAEAKEFHSIAKEFHSVVPPPPPGATVLEADIYSDDGDFRHGFTTHGTKATVDSQSNPIGPRTISNLSNDMTKSPIDGQSSTPEYPLDNEELLKRLSAIEDHLKVLHKLDEKIGSGFFAVSRDLGKLEDKTEDKLQVTFEAICREVERYVGSCHRTVEHDLQGIDRSVSKTASTLEDKVEQCFTNLNKRLQRTQTEAQDELAKVVQNFSRQTSELSKVNEATRQTVGEALGNLGHIRSSDSQSDKSANDPSDLDFDRLISTWAQQIITEGRSNTFTLQSRMASIEESQLKNRVELENRLTSKIEAQQKSFIESEDRLAHRIEDGVTSARDICIQRVNTLTDQAMKRTEEGIGQSFVGFFSKVNDSVGKHVHGAVGILQTKLDHLKDSQMKAESKTSKHVESLGSQFLKQSEEMLLKFESKLESDVKGTSTLEQAAAAQLRAKECCDMVADLTDRFSRQVTPTSTTHAGSAGERRNSFTPTAAERRNSSKPQGSEVASLTLDRPHTARMGSRRASDRSMNKGC